MASEWPTAITEQAERLCERLQSEIDDFISDHQLPASFRRQVEHYYVPLALWLAGRKEKDKTLVVGICGGQGSGKSTLTDFLQLAWEHLGFGSAGFSLDDIYLTRIERRQLAQQVHPLLETRGVPGTHDVSLGLETISRLCNSDGDTEIAIPHFDKSIDERTPEGLWPRHRGPVDILLFEGWCVGARPWENSPEPINALEREEDSRGVWRNYVNAQLEGPYQQLFAPLDTLVMLKVPDMECVLEWRRLQERKLRARHGNGMSDDEIARFVQHYERITRNLLAEMPSRADCVLELGGDHQIKRARLNN
ncbi:phosphoribulokinase [Microbulbifer rhizosphaerae]|uniref:D-glycerate 3-kinase n=1 Tax=Microbulbifer rhizosphaerae TaxID=1562603 RepID=A0A7W4WES2_9GAMM|nr:phosphoribulokinase [Microbulbifer rhizosphaerae]MBB3062318.1 D-glycerate 3-kinase [Microbulbifer rhizosphaerae]